MSYRSAVICSGIVLALAVCFEARVEACNTPVYRYAMDNWAAAPFEVYYFYRQKIGAEDEPVHRMLKDLANAKPATANLALVSVDVDKASELDRVPAPVRESWKEKHKSGVSTYLIWSPWGAEVFAGRLDRSTVREMVDSPVRTRLGELLQQGNAAVFLLLACPNAADNRRAQSVVKEVIARGASGRIPVAGAVADPSDAPVAQAPNSEPAGDVAPSSDSSRLELAQLTLSRSDPQERWLIRMLLGVEPDLPDFADEPMVYAVYGRGRAMEPFVGKGITTDNLTELAAFLAGACSCLVKDKNPGVDLLFHWDWDATVEALAAADPARSDNQPAYQEFAADAMVERLPARAKSDAAESKSGYSRPASPESAKPASLAGKPVEPAVATAVAANSPQSPSTAPPAQTAGPIASPENPGYYAGRQMWQYGLGFGLVTVFVLVIGLVVLRRHSP